MLSRTTTARGLRIIAVACAGILCAACARSQSKGTPSVPPGPVSLPAVEVRSYEGQNLSSVNDFRENSIKGVQHVERQGYRLAVTGLVKTPLSLTYDQALDRTRYSKVTTLHCVEGWSATILWEGVKVADLLEAAGYDHTATVVIFTSADGYSTSLPLEWIVDHDILLAARMNEVEVPPERGFPFVVVAEDRWGYKWAKWVTGIEVSTDTSYRGYWEERGYSQGGEYPKPFFGQ
jgi:DMSO/TMAO reductase YedYZ molybdopterin-dependent catalytic subunit